MLQRWIFTIQSYEHKPNQVSPSSQFWYDIFDIFAEFAREKLRSI